LSYALTAAQLELLRQFDTCTIADAIEAFGVRLKNEGFATVGFRCLFKGLRPMVGYAATCKIRSATPPMVGSRYVERTDWYKYITSIPAPRVVVLEDIDEEPGTGAFLGKVHVSLLVALGCTGAVTNGAARELPGIEALGFQVFAGRIAISRAYAHIVEFGSPVELGNLGIQPGDLIHGDRHGILTIPPEIAPQIPDVASRILQKKQQLMELTKKPGISLEELGQGLKELHDITASHNGDRTPQRKP
jgi:4-hydroxy-4-methyl-2-oxoglutarate aldolase